MKHQSILLLFLISCFFFGNILYLSAQSEKTSILSIPNKNYLLQGDTFKTTLYFWPNPENLILKATVNGEMLKIENGKANYQSPCHELGIQSYLVEFQYKTSHDEIWTKLSRTFEYEVGRPSLVVSSDEMNVLYKSLSNNISIAVGGFSSNDLEVKVSGIEAKLDAISFGHYSIIPYQQTRNGDYCYIEVWNKKTGKKLGAYPFRVKRIPDPEPRLSNNRTNQTIPVQEMRVQRGLMAVLENFNFDLKCEITSFTMLHIPAEGQIIELKSNQGRFEGEVKKNIQNASYNDHFLFKDIQMRCPGDDIARHGNGFLVSIAPQGLGKD